MNKSFARKLIAIGAAGLMATSTLVSTVALPTSAMSYSTSMPDYLITALRNYYTSSGYKFTYGGDNQSFVGDRFVATKVSGTTLYLALGSDLNTSSMDVKKVIYNYLASEYYNNKLTNIKTICVATNCSWMQVPTSFNKSANYSTYTPSGAKKWKTIFEGGSSSTTTTTTTTTTTWSGWSTYSKCCSGSGTNNFVYMKNDNHIKYIHIGSQSSYASATLNVVKQQLACGAAYEGCTKVVIYKGATATSKGQQWASYNL